jgi:hypothetical protein
MVNKVEILITPNQVSLLQFEEGTQEPLPAPLEV